MKILSLHCDYLKFKVLKKALKEPEKINSKEEVNVKEALGIFVAVEKSDERDRGKVVDELVKNVLDLRKQVGGKDVVLYPYAHLSSSLSNPAFALEVLQEAESVLKKKKINVYRAPFGYYKSFELKCKGHPLAELSRSIDVGEDVKEESYDSKQLLKQISKTKLDTSRLKDNDHRIIGKKMDLFSFNEMAPGMVFWHNNGLVIYNSLVDFWREEHRKADYEEISTPQILDKKLWQISGHWEKYKENIFLTDYEGREMAVKPMNCPGGILVFKSSGKSYRDLPLRVGELGTVYRQELSGVLGGLFRVVKFTQDDAHIYCADEKQVEKEIEEVMDLIDKFYKTFNFNYHVELSTRPKKKIGSEKQWDMAEKILGRVLKNKKVKFKINAGDGAFYGPKIDFHIKDSLGRTWQTATIQLDFAMPERFDLSYTGKDNKVHRPIMIHRTVYGSLERFIGVLIEHLNGNFPVWLAPIQARVISFTDRNIKGAEKVLTSLREAGFRVDKDFDSTTVSEKVRDAEIMRIPYILVVGDKEEKSKSVAVRCRGEKKIRGMGVGDLVGEILGKVEKKL